MDELRHRLIAAFLAATVVPLVATIWITTALVDRSLGYATTGELDRLSRRLEETVRELYQRERDALREDALAGRSTATTYGEAAVAGWPEPVRAFWSSGEAERFDVSGPEGDRVDYMRRLPPAGGGPSGVAVYSRDLGGIHLDELRAELRQAREVVGSIEGRDLRRGFTLTLLLLLGAAWLVSLVPLVVIAHRTSRPIRQLTAALSDFAGGDWSRRIDTGRPPGRPARDELGRAVDAFNHMAVELDESRQRLVHLTQMASWQSLARKTAHELKNSLTPIRLTVEEMLARQPPADRAFMERAVQIVVGEIDALERRVRAFSEFASEPPVNPEVLDVDALVAERVTLVRTAHPDTVCELRLDGGDLRVHAGADLLRGLLTNLLQNAAEAAGAHGRILAVTRRHGGQVVVEVHDSGPGLSADARATLFEPTITFKRHGMGLGLSIARKHALLSGGDIALVDGELGGAGFRVTLPALPADRAVREAS